MNTNPLWSTGKRDFQKVEVDNVKRREFVPLKPQKLPEWHQKRITEYRAIPSLYK